MRSYVTLDDYPREAVRNGWEGLVRVDLTIGTKGRVTDCKVIKSSGHAVLDTTTCKIMMTRARFQPARDDAGNAVEDHYETQINWQLE